MNMLPFVVLILSSVLSDCLTNPTTESTHALLQRLGFDHVQKPVINHHKKRVAQEMNKARHHIDSYNTETDSHMYIVKLPPHSPYYSHMIPEKFENEVTLKTPATFRTNGKPAGVYHWNIPVIKKLPQAYFGGNQIPQADSKVYHVKILPNEHHKDKIYKKFNKLKKQRYEDIQDAMKPQRNSLRVHNLKHQNARKDQLKKEHGRLESTKMKNKNYNNPNVMRDATIAKRQRGPSYYQPALPKQNSFHKDFEGNGKPKSFYVIEKSNKATRYHRLF